MKKKKGGTVKGFAKFMAYNTRWFTLQEVGVSIHGISQSICLAINNFLFSVIIHLQKRDRTKLNSLYVISELAMIKKQVGGYISRMYHSYQRGKKGVMQASFSRYNLPRER